MTYCFILILNVFLMINLIILFFNKQLIIFCKYSWLVTLAAMRSGIAGLQQKEVDKLVLQEPRLVSDAGIEWTAHKVVKGGYMRSLHRSNGGVQK